MSKPFSCALLTVSEIVKEAHDNSVEKGFHEPPGPSVGEQIALAHSELSEALEAYRERGLDIWYRKDGKPEGFLFELADAVIRIADTCGGRKLDLERAIVEKMAFNRTRPYRHGGKKL